MLKQTGPSRLGTWRAGAAGLDVDVPAFVLLTRSGFVPFVTADLVHACVGEGDPVVLAVPLSYVVDVGCELMEANKGQGLAGFCGLAGTKTVVLVVAEDPLAPFAGGKINKKRVVVQTAKGHSNVSPLEYARLVRAACADLVSFPSNEPEHAGSVKSQDKSVNGTLQFMDACRLHVRKRMRFCCLCSPACLSGSCRAARPCWA